MAEGMGGKILGWAEAHPAQAVMAGGVIVLGVLWLLGVFDRPQQQSDGGASNMAAAYYAAEAQQAVIGGQIQVANIAATRDTAIAGLETDAAVKLGNIQANAAQTINQQNADVSTKLGEFGLEATKSEHWLLKMLGEYGLNATYSNNATAQAINASNNATAQSINYDNNLTTRLMDYFHTVLPQEFAAFPGRGLSTYIPGIGQLELWGGSHGPNEARAAGYSENTLSRWFG
jgi:hypothetical protein